GGVGGFAAVGKLLELPMAYPAVLLDAEDIGIFLFDELHDLIAHIGPLYPSVLVEPPYIIGHQLQIGVQGLGGFPAETVKGAEGQKGQEQDEQGNQDLPLSPIPPIGYEDQVRDDQQGYH